MIVSNSALYYVREKNVHTLNKSLLSYCMYPTTETVNYSNFRMQIASFNTHFLKPKYLCINRFRQLPEYWTKTKNKQKNKTKQKQNKKQKKKHALPCECSLK